MQLLRCGGARCRSDQLEELEDGGWRPIDPAGSRDGYRDMADFVAEVPDRRAAELLDRAISGRGAFRRFKDTLFEFPDLREPWFRFRDARATRRAIDWLEFEQLVSPEDAERARAAPAGGAGRPGGAVE